MKGPRGLLTMCENIGPSGCKRKYTSSESVTGPPMMNRPVQCNLHRCSIIQIPKHFYDVSYGCLLQNVLVLDSSQEATLILQLSLSFDRGQLVMMWMESWGHWRGCESFFDCYKLMGCFHFKCIQTAICPSLQGTAQTDNAPVFTWEEEVPPEAGHSPTKIRA